MERQVHNSTWAQGIEFRGRHFQGPTELYRCVDPRPAVPLATFVGRLNRFRVGGDLSEARLEEALYLSASAFRAKYGVRKSWIVLNGEQFPLTAVYEEAQDRRTVTYRVFWQRVRRLERCEAKSSESVEDALTLGPADWRTFYGGGRHRTFVYAGDEFPEQVGRSFHSRAAFLKTIGRYQDRSTVWSRLKAGWDLDAALIEPVVNEVGRTGRIYTVTRRRTGQVYVGLTVLSLEGRWAHHVASSRKGGAGKLSRAIAEDGSEAFDLDVVEDGIVGSENLKDRERFWVRKLDALGPQGLNTAKAGGLGLRRGKKVEFEGEEFDSMTEAAAMISGRRGLEPHVVATRLREGAALPERARRHSRHPRAGSNLFRIWLALKRRHPGAVETCWMESFDAFETDVEPSREKGLELVRKDSDRPWGPRNFEWVSTSEKVARTHGTQVVIGGRTYKTIRAAAEAHGLGVSTLKYRLSKGLSIEEAVSAPLGATSFRNPRLPLVVDGLRFRSKRQAILYIARSRKLTEGQAKYRFEQGRIE